MRKQKLQINPLCETCLQYARVEPAAVVDHTIPMKAPGGEAYPPLDRLQSLCARCHNRKTRCEQLGTAPTIKGCDARGYPLDPRHPWYDG
jgi:5-methylcytosine-specific restriction protein A